MPYDNLPQGEWDKMDKCVEKVQAQGHDKDSAIAICYTAITEGKATAKDAESVKEFCPMNIVEIVKGLFAPAETLTLDEIATIDQLYLDVKAGKLVLGEPEEEKAVNNFPRGQPSGGSPGGGTPGTTASMLNKRGLCAARMRQMGMDEQSAGRICKRAFPDATTKETKPKGYRRFLTEQELRERSKAITDAPGLRGDDQRSCVNCNQFKYLPPTNTQVGLTDGSAKVWESKGVCAQYEFETDGGWVCDSWEEWQPKALSMEQAGVTVTKQADGTYRWVIVSSSSFEDRDKEIVSQKALEEDTDAMNQGGQFGWLDWWHTPIVLGDCDFSAMHGKLSIESGTFRNGDVAVKLAEHANELAASRSFRHSVTEPGADGVYTHIRTFARALLPRGKESNLLTQVTIAPTEESMQDEKRKELVAKLGGDAAAEEMVNGLLTQAAQTEKTAESAGIKHKEETPPEPDKPAWFLGDMKPEEFGALVGQAMTKAVEPLMVELRGLKESATTKATADTANHTALLEAVAKAAQSQAALMTRVGMLEGLTPRGFRPSQAESTVTNKDASPHADEATPYLMELTNKIFGGTNAAPKP